MKDAMNTEEKTRQRGKRHTPNLTRYEKNFEQVANTKTVCKLAAYKSLAAHWSSGGSVAMRVVKCQMF
jgi:hypothetical protein